MRIASAFGIALVAAAQFAHGAEQVMTPGQVFEAASPSVVVVHALDAQGKVITFGSGVVIAPAQVVTNCHVSDKGARLEVKSGPRALPASLRYADRERDLCQLAVPGLTAPAVKIGSVKQLKIGARVVALGAPRGLELSLSDGIVSALRGAGDASIIQTTAPISPGSSGGGLFDEEGHLIGITTFYLDEGQNLNFALPADWIAALPERATTAEPKAFDESAWLLKAGALEGKNDWDASLAHARAWTKANPRSAMARNNLGFVYVTIGQNEPAITAFRETLRIDPRHAEAWNNLGVAYGQTGQGELAISAYREALRFNPQMDAAWKNLGAAYGKAGQTDRKINALREALRINPDDADTWNNLGITYKQAAQTEQAITAYREALRINPELAKAWNNLGRAYGQAGQIYKEIAAYREALRINPELADTWTSLGFAYANTSQIEPAIQARREALRIDPQDAEAWIHVGFSYGDAGQTHQEINAYREALRINPEHVWAWIHLGSTYSDAGQTNRAINALREALRIDPQEASAWFYLGAAYAIKGERTQVLEVYRQLRALNPAITGNPALVDRFFNEVVTPR